MSEIFVYLYFTLKDNEKLLEYMCDEKLYDLVDITMATQFCSKLNYKYLTIFDREYYEYIEDLENPPLIIFYIGNIKLLKSDNILIIGDNKMSSYAENLLNDVIRKTTKNVIITNDNYFFNCKVIPKCKMHNKGVILIGNSCLLKMQKKHKLYDNLIISFNVKKYNKLVNNFKLLHLVKNIVIIETSKNEKMNTLVNYSIERNINVMVAPGRIYDFKMHKNNMLISDGATILNFSDL